MRRVPRSLARGPGGLEIEGYADLTEIGSGTSATVYRAFQDAFQRQVALKILTADVSDQRARRRFVSERAMTGRLSRHPNVITVYDSGFTGGGRPYLAMEFCPRGSYADLGPLAVPDALRVGVKIAGALESAHRAGVIHRDIKPQNILQSGYGEPVLADFGLAMALDPEASFTAGLTPAHAAPELLEGGSPTASTDVYALGSTLYTLLAGRPPFAGPVGEGLLPQFRRIAEGAVPEIPRADVTPSLMRLLRRALAPPSERFSTAVDLGRALQAEQTALGLPVTELVSEADSAIPPPSRSIVTTGPTDETAAPAAVFAPPAPPVVTVGPPETATLTGRIQAPPTPPAVRGRRSRPLAVGAAGTGVVVVVGVGAGLLLSSGGGPRAAAPKPAAVPGSAVVVASTGAAVAGPAVASPSAPSSAAPTSAFVNAAPSDVVAKPDSTGLERLTWRDRTGGTAMSLIYASVAGAPYARLDEVGRGTHAAVVSVTTGAPTCFKVIAAISLGNTPGSDPVCINGGVAPTATPAG